MRPGVLVSAAFSALALAACGPAPPHDVQKELCAGVLLDAESAYLKPDKWGDPPEALRLSSYASHKCMRLRSIMRASEDVSDEEAARRAIEDCAQPIAKEAAEEARWASEPISRDPEVEREYRRITREMQPGPDAEAMRLGHAALIVSLARSGKCWEPANSPDLAVE